MDEHRYQLIGLSGFIVAGLIFVVSGLRSGDELTVAGSIVWTVACIAWMVPLLRPPRS